MTDFALVGIIAVLSVISMLSVFLFVIYKFKD